jgi:uncharacterized protein DUF4824
MMTWSRQRSLVAGAGLILIANAVVLIGAAYNRSAPADSVLRLTQREARPSYRSWGIRENSGLALTVQWRVPTQDRADPSLPMVSYGPYGGTVAWLDAAKLRELGFDVSQPLDTDRKRSFYARELPRQVFVVLELDGAAYQASLRTVREYGARQEALRAANPGKKEFEDRARHGNDLLKQEEQANGRLFAIDAGLDAAALRAKYRESSRYAIVRGRVRAYAGWDSKNPEPTGFVSDLGVDEINVPSAFRSQFADARDGYVMPAGSSYEVTVAFGKRLEPWIVDVARKGTP